MPPLAKGTKVENLVPQLTEVSYSSFATARKPHAPLRDNRAMRVIGKGRRERLIPVDQDLLGCIREELAQRPGALSDDPLCVNREGKRYRSLRTPLSRACEIAGVPHLLHHSLRHAYAKLQHKRGTDMVLLSRLLGHANPTVTQNTYVDPFPEEVRKAGEAFKIDMKQKGAKEGNGSFSGMQTVGDRANLLHLSVPGWRNWQTHRT